MLGIPVKDQKDNTGKLLRDYTLVKKLSTIYPWFKNVYHHTSGYVHLSEKHFLNSITFSGNYTVKLKMKITDQDAFVTEENYKEAVISFRKATDVVFDCVRGWIYSKNNPKKKILTKLIQTQHN